MKEKCVIGGLVLWHCRMNFQLSTLLRKYMGYLGRCVLVDVITYMIDRCLGPIDTHVGSRVSKERASRVSYAEQFGVLLSMTWFTYGLSLSEKLKNSWRGQNRGNQSEEMWKDVKFWMMFKGSCCNSILTYTELFVLTGVYHITSFMTSAYKLASSWGLWLVCF